MKDSPQKDENQRSALVATLAAAALPALCLAHPAWVERAALWAVASLLLGAACLWTLWRRGPLPRPPAMPLAAAAAWVAVLALSAALHDSPAAALVPPLAGLTWAAAGWVLGGTPTGAPRLTVAVTAGVGAAALWALAQHLGVDPVPRVDEFTDRIVGPFENPNHLASLCAAALPLVLSRYLAHAAGQRPLRPCLAWGLTIVVIYAAMLLAGSRGALYAGLAGALCLGLGVVRGILLGGARPRIRAAVGLLGALTVTTLALQHRPVMDGAKGEVVSVQQRVQAMSHVAGEGARTDATVLHRRVLWRTAARLTASHPWLGVGPGNYAAAATDLLPEEVQRQGPYARSLLWVKALPAAHNEWLHAAAESGLLGVLALAVLTAAGWGTGALRAWGEPCLPVWGLLGVGTATLVHGLVSYPLLMPATSSLYWILLGISMRWSQFPEEPIEW